MKKHTLCGKDITKDIDKKSTKESIEVLRKIKELSNKYKIIIIKDKIEYNIFDYIIFEKELYIKHKVKGSVRFYDTLDDEDNYLLFYDSDYSILKLYFKIDKIGYTNQLLNYITLLSIDSPNDGYDQYGYRSY
jgi:hypothetical protein